MTPKLSRLTDDDAFGQIQDCRSSPTPEQFKQIAVELGSSEITVKATDATLMRKMQSSPSPAWQESPDLQSPSLRAPDRRTTRATA